MPNQQKPSPTDLRKTIIDLGYEISGDLDHGECFYDKGMLDQFLQNLDILKTTAIAYYNANKEEGGDYHGSL